MTMVTITSTFDWQVKNIAAGSCAVKKLRGSYFHISAKELVGARERADWSRRSTAKQPRLRHKQITTFLMCLPADKPLPWFVCDAGYNPVQLTQASPFAQRAKSNRGTPGSKSVVSDLRVHECMHFVAYGVRLAYVSLRERTTSIS